MCMHTHQEADAHVHAHAHASHLQTPPTPFPTSATAQPHVAFTAQCTHASLPMLSHQHVLHSPTPTRTTYPPPQAGVRLTFSRTDVGSCSNKIAMIAAT